MQRWWTKNHTGEFQRWLLAYPGIRFFLRIMRSTLDGLVKLNGEQAGHQDYQKKFARHVSLEASDCVKLLHASSFMVTYEVQLEK